MIGDAPVSLAGVEVGIVPGNQELLEGPVEERPRAAPATAPQVLPEDPDGVEHLLFRAVEEVSQAAGGESVLPGGDQQVEDRSEVGTPALLRAGAADRADLPSYEFPIDAFEPVRECRSGQFVHGPDSVGDLLGEVEHVQVVALTGCGQSAGRLVVARTGAPRSAQPVAGVGEEVGAGVRCVVHEVDHDGVRQVPNGRGDPGVVARGEHEPQGEPVDAGEDEFGDRTAAPVGERFVQGVDDGDRSLGRREELQRTADQLFEGLVRGGVGEREGNLRTDDARVRVNRAGGGRALDAEFPRMPRPLPRHADQGFGEPGHRRTELLGE